MGEKFCIRFFTVQKEYNKVNIQVWRLKVLPNIYLSVFTTFQVIIAMACLITILVFGEQYSFQNGEQQLFTTILHWWQHSKILKSGLVTNDVIFYFMTSLGTKPIATTISKLLS